MHNFSQIVFPLNDREIKYAAPYVSQIWALLTNLDALIMETMDTAGNKYGRIKYIVDVGACTGGMVIPYTVAFPDAQILAIEPSRYNCNYLQFNCKGLDNVEILKIAANNKKGMIQVAAPSPAQRDRVDHDKNTGLISVYGTSDRFREYVVADTLDNVIDRKVDWLKIDVEGHEQSVLEGSTRILSEDRPMLQIEMSEENQAMGPYTLSGLLKLIGDWEYINVGKIRGDLLFAPTEIA